MAGKGKHNEIDLEKLELLAETGMSEENIARCMDIKYPTFRLWIIYLNADSSNIHGGLFYHGFCQKSI